MKPLRIECHVEQPIVYSGDGLHLDGLIAYGVYARMSREEQAALPNVYDSPDLDLPLERWGDGENWVWKASAAYVDWTARTQVEIRRMTNADAMTRHSKDAVVNISNGQFKGMDLRYEARYPAGGVLTWYAVGEPDEIALCLEKITNIGKIHNHGHEKIRCDIEGKPEWTITEDEAAHDKWTHRNMPEAGGAPTPTRPPYWNHVQFRPGRRVR